MAIATPLDEFRLLSGDREATAPLFNDIEAQWFLDHQNGNVRLAVADSLEALAREYARKFDTTIDGQTFRLSQVAQAYLEQARQLRATAGQSLATSYVTRVDGYSDDIPASDTRSVHSRGRRRTSWDLCGYDLDPDRDIPA